MFLKDFLNNFEKDKLKAVELVRKYSAEKKIREKKMMDDVNKCAEKREKEIDLLQIEEENKKKQELEKIRMKELERIRLRNKENSEKINQIRAHAKDKTANENKYLFKVLENKYKEKTEKEIDKILTDLLLAIRKANAIYPQTMPEYEERRLYQTKAICAIDCLTEELSFAVALLNRKIGIDINRLEPYLKLIEEEYGLRI